MEHLGQLRVATVLTVYGIETNIANSKRPSAPPVATVLTVYGIETFTIRPVNHVIFFKRVATVLTVYGIETIIPTEHGATLTTLQQYLPFTVLKLEVKPEWLIGWDKLQQYLPFTVLKHVA